MTNTTLEKRYHAVRQRIAEAARRAGRTDDPVYLVAVTKFAEPEDIRTLLELGHRDFGESRVQQLAQRAAMLGEWFERMKMLPETITDLDRRCANPRGAMGADDSVRWHMIGHLQRNKARKVVDATRLIHSVESLRLVEELQILGNKRENPIDVLVQVNISGEESKSGCPLPAVGAICDQIDSMISVRVRGLMTMAPLSDNPEDSRTVFRRCRELFEELRKAGVSKGHFNLLSMGMSGDFEVAIEEGANIVRVGTAIFGNREPAGKQDAQAEPAAN